MLFFFTESVASEILDIVAVAGVLKSGGIRNLPVLYIFDEVLLASILGVYAVLVNRVERTRLFNLMEALFGTLVLFLYVGGKFPNLDYFVGIGTYAVKSLAISILEENFWMFVDDIYDVREAKRLTPVITTSGVVGGIVGSAGLGIVAGSIVKDLNTFRLVAPVVMFSGIFFMTRVKAAATAEGRLKDRSRDDAAKAAKRKKKRASKAKPTFRDGVAFIKSSPLFSAVFWTFVVAGVVAPLGDFAFQATADMYAADEKSYARFLAFYKTGLTIFIFFAQLFLSGRLMKRLGIANSQLFTPINNVFKFLLLIPFVKMWTAIYTQGSKKLLEKVIQKPAQRILFGFAPKRQKNTIRVFIKQVKGYAAIGTLVSLFVALRLMPAGFEDLSDTATRVLFIRIVSAALVVLSLFWLWQAARLKRVFAESLVQILQSEEVDFEALEREDFRNFIDSKTIMFLWKNLEAGNDKRAVFITEILGEMADARLLRPIAELMPRKGPEVRRALVKLAGRIGGEEAQPFLVNALRSREAGVRAEALRAIGANDYMGIHDAVRPLVDDADEGVRVEAAAIMLHSSDVELKKEGARVLDAMLGSDDTRRRLNGIYLLGRLGVKRNVRAVLPFLADPDDEVRLEALKALCELVDAGSDPHVGEIAELLSDSSQEVRAEAARVLGRIGSDQAVAPLLETLSQRGTAIRRAAIASLAIIGTESREALVEAVADPKVDLATKEMILSALRHTAEADQVRARLVPILDELLRVTYSRVADLRALETAHSQEPGLAFLVKAIHEAIRDTRDLVLSIMIILADPDRYRLIRKGLLAGDRGTKANMLELLESTSERTVFNLLMPLLEETTADERLALAKRTWNLEGRNVPAAFIACLVSTTPTIRLAAIYAAAELGMRELEPALRRIAAESKGAAAREARRSLEVLAGARRV